MLGTSSPLTFLYIGFSENSQSEYYNTATKIVDVPYVLQMFLIPFFLTAIITFAFTFVLITFLKNK
jgi:hypothetical protein